ncbi:hypothetical protein WJR50_25510 [Catalinimonas sp. 4WD22]|uniref:hypothetical protein n=1 Tax=Catalinimonas locisalis TaxID=3133978 RepID=UPI0031013F8C
MEVFADWQLENMVARLMALSNKAALSFASVLLALRIFVEIFKSYTSYRFRFTIPQFVPILLIIIGLLTYREIITMIGDAFLGLAEYIRGEAELSFRLTNIWEALKEKLGVEEEEQSMWELVQNWAGYISDQANPFDWIQNWWGLATALSWQALSVLIRAGMIVFKNIVYAYMLIVGPIPLVLSLIPGFQGMAAHWIKNFIVVCYWNVTLALLDAIMQALNVQILADIAFGGDEEMTIGLLTALSAIMYFFVPYLSSMAIGQTVVAMSGSKMVMAPLATAVGVGRLAASGGTSKATSAATKAAHKPIIPSGGGGERSPSGLVMMGTQRNPDVHKNYTASPVRTRNVVSGSNSTPGRVFYGSRHTNQISQSRMLDGKQAARIQSPSVNENLKAPRTLPPSETKPRYLIGPKTKK